MARPLSGSPSDPWVNLEGSAILEARQDSGDGDKDLSRLCSALWHLAHSKKFRKASYSPGDGAAFWGYHRDIHKGS